MARAAGVLEPDDWDWLVPQALYHRVGAEVHGRLRTVLDADHPALLGELAHVEEENVLRHLRAMADLEHLREVLDQLHVPWLVFKGPVLAEQYRERPGLRGYADLDVLVPRERFPDVVEGCELAGRRLLDRNWHVIADEQRGQLHLTLPFGTELDLHWDIVNRQAVRRSVDMDAADLFARARDIEVGGMVVRTFGPEDTLLHLLLHGGLAGADRLVWLRDVERVVALERRVDWDEVVVRAGQWQVRRLVGTVLLRTRDAIGADVPEAVVERVLGPWGRRLSRILDVLSPAGSARRQPTVGGLWTRSQRDDLPGTIRTMAVKAARGLGPARAARAWLTRRPPMLDGHGPYGALRPSGDRETREDYLAAVARGAGSVSET